MDIRNHNSLKLSVIIPVYNQENRIEDMIRDCLKQDYDSFQLILVNDGSSDNTAKVCERWVAYDDRISLINIENSGPAKAREVGLMSADGDYVFFADSDDFLPDNIFKLIIDKISISNYADIVRGAFYIRRGMQDQCNKCPWSEGFVSKRGDSNQIRRYHQLKNSSPFGYMWSAVYKRSFLVKSGINMGDIGLDFMEDTVINLELFTLNPSYYIFNEPIYGYVIYDNSLSVNSSRDYKRSVLNVAKSYGEYLNNHHIYEDNLDNYAPLVARCFCYALVQTQMHNKMSLKETYRWIESFAEDRYVKDLLNTKGAIAAIKTISSVAERSFYSFCMNKLRYHNYKILALIFKTLIGPMNAYIRLSTKH